MARAGTPKAKCLRAPAPTALATIAALPLSLAFASALTLPNAMIERADRRLLRDETGKTEVNLAGATGLYFGLDSRQVVGEMSGKGCMSLPANGLSDGTIRIR